MMKDLESTQLDKTGYKMSIQEKATAIFLFITAIDNLKWYRKKTWKKFGLDKTITFKEFDLSWKESTYEEKSEFLESHLSFDYDSNLIHFINLYNISTVEKDKKKAIELFKEYQQIK